MSDFNAIMHHIQFRLGAYSAPPDAQLDLGALLLRERGKGSRRRAGMEDPQI